MKLLQFHRNYRPAFYGTFRRKVKLSGRAPYRKDTNCFDYEFDSGERISDKNLILALFVHFYFTGDFTL